MCGQNHTILTLPLYLLPFILTVIFYLKYLSFSTISFYFLLFFFLYYRFFLVSNFIILLSSFLYFLSLPSSVFSLLICSSRQVENYHTIFPLGTGTLPLMDQSLNHGVARFTVGSERSPCHGTVSDF